MYILWVLVFHFAWREFINVEFLNFNSTNLSFFLFTLISGGRRYSWGLGWWATSWVPVNQEADFHQILNLLVLWSWTSMSLHGTMSLPAVFAQTHGWRDWRKVLKGEEVPSLLAQLALKAGPRTQKEAGVFVFFLWILLQPRQVHYFSPRHHTSKHHTHQWVAFSFQPTPQSSSRTHKTPPPSAFLYDKEPPFQTPSSLETFSSSP